MANELLAVTGGKQRWGFGKIADYPQNNGVGWNRKLPFLLPLMVYSDSKAPPLQIRSGMITALSIMLRLVVRPVMDGVPIQLTNIQKTNLFANVSPDKKRSANFSEEGLFVMDLDGSDFSQLIGHPQMYGVLSWIH